MRIDLDEETLAKLRKALEPYNNGPRVNRVRCQSKCGRWRHVSVLVDGERPITWHHDAKTRRVCGTASELVDGIYRAHPETPPNGFSFEDHWNAADDIEPEE